MFYLMNKTYRWEENVYNYGNCGKFIYSGSATSQAPYLVKFLHDLDSDNTGQSLAQYVLVLEAERKTFRYAMTAVRQLSTHS